jgi:betaine-aldehyde dehydrogenase
LTAITGKFEAPLLIDGSLVAGHDGDWFDSFEPANGRVLGRAALAAASDVDEAVAAASRAQPAWSAMSDADRAKKLRDLAAAIEERSSEIVEIEARDTGNTLLRLKNDVEIAAASLRYFAGLIPAIKGETTRSNASNMHFSLRDPYGVVARIVPFNHPFMFAAARIAAPLAAGNSVVVKTPEQSPLSSRLLAEACCATLPDGVVNILHGPGDPTGTALVKHRLVKRIGFTGSVTTGRLIQRSAAEAGVKHVSLELGGKNPMVIMSDIAPERAARIAVAGMNFAWAGQSCGSTSRVLVHDSIYDEVVERIATLMEALVVGNPLDPVSQMGPVNSASQLAKVEQHIAWAQEDGARLLTGGGRPQGAGFQAGYWIRPTAFADVSASMRLAQQEVFGPVMALMRWRDEEEALSIANGTDLGLTASIWTNQLDAALRFSRKIDAGYVWINGSSTHFPGMPFSGRRESGVGSEEGIDELLSYTETKAIHMLMEDAK